MQNLDTHLASLASRVASNGADSQITPALAYAALQLATDELGVSSEIVRLSGAWADPVSADAIAGRSSQEPRVRTFSTLGVRVSDLLVTFVCEEGLPVGTRPLVAPMPPGFWESDQTACIVGDLGTAMALWRVRDPTPDPPPGAEAGDVAVRDRLVEPAA